MANAAEEVRGGRTRYGNTRRDRGKQAGKILRVYMEPSCDKFAAKRASLVMVRFQLRVSSWSVRYQPCIFVHHSRTQTKHQSATAFS